MFFFACLIFFMISSGFHHADCFKIVGGLESRV